MIEQEGASKVYILGFVILNAVKNLVPISRVAAGDPSLRSG